MADAMDFLDRITFASDAELLALWGAGFVMLAGIAALADKRRASRRDIERLEQVGWVPWTPIFLGALVIGGGLLAMSLPVVIGNL